MDFSGWKLSKCIFGDPCHDRARFPQLFRQCSVSARTEPRDGVFRPDDGIVKCSPDVAVRALSIDEPGQTKKVRWQLGISDAKQVHAFPSECSEKQPELKDDVVPDSCRFGAASSDGVLARGNKDRKIDFVRLRDQSIECEAPWGECRDVPPIDRAA